MTLLKLLSPSLVAQRVIYSFSDLYVGFFNKDDIVEPTRLAVKRLPSRARVHTHTQLCLYDPAMCPVLGIPPKENCLSDRQCWCLLWVLAEGCRWLGENNSLGDKEGGCQQESGIPEHLVTGSQQNMSCRTLAIYTSPVTIRASRDTPCYSDRALQVPSLFLALSVLPIPPKDQACSLVRRKRKDVWKLHRKLHLPKLLCKATVGPALICPWGKAPKDGLLTPSLSS